MAKKKVEKEEVTYFGIQGFPVLLKEELERKAKADKRTVGIYATMVLAAHCKK